MRSWIALSLPLAALLAPIALADAADSPTPSLRALASDEAYPPGVVPAAPLPRYREGGTPYNASQAMAPFAVSRPESEPSSGLVSSPAEYGPMRGVLYAYVPGQWTAIVTQLVKELTNDPNCPTCDEIAYVVVRNATDENAARNAFIAAGANINKVKFIRTSLEALWIRDYGPHFVWQNGALAISDSHYYPERPNDNFVPTVIGDDYALDPLSTIPPLRVPTFDQPLYYSGGNVQPGPNRTGFMTALVNLDNPSSQGFDADHIARVFDQHMGFDTLHVMPQLPFSVDGTGHIDMWFYLVDDNDVIISEFKPGSNATAISITNNAVPYMQNLGFTVHRTPAWNVGSTHYTYANAFRVNHRIFTIRYNAYPTDNAVAQAAFQAAAGPGVLLNPIECTAIIPAAGAIHCIVMQVPRSVAPTPAVHVISPAGGERLVSGATHTIRWGATDTDNALIPDVDLYYSLDDGANWQLIANTPSTGSYDWTVPVAASNIARVRVVANAADDGVGEGMSEGAFTIQPAGRSAYDFAAGAGVDKFVYGFQTSSWSLVNTTRKPAFNPLSTSNYARLASSNATGGDSDANRYIAGSPSSGFESTHTFEFTVPDSPADLARVSFLWEGYADLCAQAELYVWDYVAGRWGDGAGTDLNLNFGQNRLASSWAGNRDGLLTVDLHDNLDRYIDPNGQVTFLVYVERGTSGSGAVPSFHDYARLETVAAPAGCPGDMNCDGLINFADIDYFVAALSGEAAFIAQHIAATGNPPTCFHTNGDANGDALVNFSDIDAFVALIGTTCP